jgi:hypothetical protein
MEDSKLIRERINLKEKGQLERPVGWGLVLGLLEQLPFAFSSA